MRASISSKHSPQPAIPQPLSAPSFSNVHGPCLIVSLSPPTPSIPHRTTHASNFVRAARRRPGAPSALVREPETGRGSVSFPIHSSPAVERIADAACRIRPPAGTAPQNKKKTSAAGSQNNRGEATRYASSETRDTEVSVHGERGTTTARRKQRPKTARCRNVVSAIRSDPVFQPITTRRLVRARTIFGTTASAHGDTPQATHPFAAHPFPDPPPLLPETTKMPAGTLRKGLREAPPNFVRPAAPSTVYRKT